MVAIADSQLRALRVPLFYSCILVGLAAPAVADFLGSYKKGVRAIKQGQWERAADLMRAAIADRPRERGGLPGRMYFHDYIPHYYLGLALFEQGDCEGALEAWAESLRQGLITRRKEHEIIQAKRPTCERLPREEISSADLERVDDIITQAVVKAETVATLAKDPELRTGWAEGSRALITRRQQAEKLLEQARQALAKAKAESSDSLLQLQVAESTAAEALGQLEAIQREASRRREAIRDQRQAEQRDARQALGRLAGSARELISAMDRYGAYPTGLESRRRELEQLVRASEVAETRTSIEDLEVLDARLSRAVTALKAAFRPPPEELLAAVEAYFAGSYRDVVDRLEGHGFRDRRAVAHASLLLAAARFALYRSGDGKGDALLETVHQNILEAQAAEPSLAPLQRAFTPEFIELFNRKLSSAP